LRTPEDSRGVALIFCNTISFFGNYVLKSGHLLKLNRVSSSQGLFVEISQDIRGMSSKIFRWVLEINEIGSPQASDCFLRSSIEGFEASPGSPCQELRISRSVIKMLAFFLIHSSVSSRLRVQGILKGNLWYFWGISVFSRDSANVRCWLLVIGGNGVAGGKDSSRISASQSVSLAFTFLQALLWMLDLRSCSFR
jgi:hypothetical protein